MSYILSALKKAERERRLGEVPDLPVNDIIDEGYSSGPSRGAKFAVGLVALVAVNVVLYFWLDTETPAPTPTPARIAPVEAPRVAPPPAVRKPVAPPPAVRDEFVREPPPKLAPRRTEPVPQRPDKAPKKAPRVVPPGGATPNYDDLPVDVRAGLPELDISGHVFVPGRPRLSRVIINGRTVRTGQLVEGDVRVYEITAGAVIFQFGGGRFRLSTDRLF